MPYFVLVLFFLLGSNLAFAQYPDDCYQDPSCQHSKQMMTKAVQQWGDSDRGINSNKRSDSIDIINYLISLDMRDLEQKYIQGFCELDIKSKIAKVNGIQLDLLQFQIDSILYNNHLVKYSYNDTIINIAFGESLPKGKSAKLRVYYQGSPQQDKSWGGFYYQKDYAFNMGVGFYSNPHNFGRIWHPCFDNFIEKATYRFHILTSIHQTAQCNGQLISRTIKEDRVINDWELSEPIPTYLACVAISDYITIQKQYKGAYGTVPIELAARVEDSAKLLQSFQNLSACIAAYEYWYGRHRWPKVGYSLVPFRAGAMEHATNIAYPVYAANGTLKYESLMAHELGHSWWGNNVTCETAQDMWINEGMASYSVHLFYEYHYGKKHYLEAVKKNHVKTLLSAHKKEGGYRPISGVPFAYTYGSHVYKKGAVVAHNLRGYLGDSLFRLGLQRVQEDYQFQNINSPQFRDALSEATGVNLTAFFDDWVFTGGYPHFAIQQYSIQKSKKGYSVDLQIQQKLLGRDIYHKNVPLELSFLGKNWEEYTARIVCNQLTDTLIELSFEPVSIIVNKNHWLNQATIDFDMIIYPNKKYYPRLGLTGLQNLEVEQFKDSVYLHCSTHLVSPSHLPEGYQTINHKYWSLQGVFKADFKATIQLENPDEAADLFYRSTPNGSWKRLHFKKKKLAKFKLKKGDYCWAKKIVKDSSNRIINLRVSVADDMLVLKINSSQNQKVFIKIYDAQQKLIHKRKESINEDSSNIKVFDYNQKKKAAVVCIYDMKGQLLAKNKVHL